MAAAAELSDVGQMYVRGKTPAGGSDAQRFLLPGT